MKIAFKVILVLDSDIKAAEQGTADAQNELGYCYKHGIGVGKDAKKAVELFQKATEQGHAVGGFLREAAALPHRDNRAL